MWKTRRPRYEVEDLKQRAGRNRIKNTGIAFQNRNKKSVDFYGNFIRKRIQLWINLKTKFVLNNAQVWIYPLIIALFAQNRISWPKTY
ncbi:hypothetical protein ASG14_16545 [Pedobacter sp. Leaf194]|nr:hypothetical protein ASG14_16545 [Pedobacter sp. Leaf194]